MFYVSAHAFFDELYFVVVAFGIISRVQLRYGNFEIARDAVGFHFIVGRGLRRVASGGGRAST
jgi:hypothetical protein